MKTEEAGPENLMDEEIEPLELDWAQSPAKPTTFEDHVYILGRYALVALVVLSFTESSFFPIPPDILLMAMCFARPQKWVLYSGWCTVASVAGGIAGWFLGWGFWEITKDFFYSVVPGFTPEVFGKVQHLYADNAFLAILAAAFTPIPYKVFTVAAGVFAISIPTLIIASIIGRGARFFLVGGVIRFFGPKAKPFLERNFEVATLLLLGLFIAGFGAMNYLKH